jgi:RNA polymerase sigma factor (sigma-70 family)
MNNAMLLYAHLTDKELVDKVLSGHKSSFEVLIRRHSQALYRVGRMYSLSHIEAEDHISETFHEAFTQLKRFQNPVSFRTWLTKFMIDNCLKTRKEGDVTKEEFIEPACIPARSADLNDSIRLTRENINALEACIEQLPIPLRSVYILREIDGYSVEETAHLLNTSTDNVVNRLKRAKASLRKSLRKWYQYSDLYPQDPNSHERVVHDIMSRVHKKSTHPAGVPTF